MTARYVPAGPARAHLERLAATYGLSDYALGALVGIDGRHIHQIRNPRHRRYPTRLRTVTHVHIMRARFDLDLLPDAANLDASGTVRRIHALQAIGWTLADIGDRLGVRYAAVGNIGRRGSVQALTARRVRDVYAALELTPGPSLITARRAAARGWARPVDWEGVDLDDPASTPWRDERDPHERHCDAQRRVDLSDLDLLASDGHTVATAAARLGVGADAIRQACRRHLRGDLLARLERNGLVAS